MPNAPEQSSGLPDLTTLGNPAAAEPAVRVGEIVEKSYDPTPARENVRGLIAQALVWTLVGVIAVVVLTGLVTIYACHTDRACSAETVDLKTIRAVIELVLTPLIGLVGAVTGFYFGEKSAAGKSAN